MTVNLPLTTREAPVRVEGMLKFKRSTINGVTTLVAIKSCGTVQLNGRYRCHAEIALRHRGRVIEGVADYADCSGWGWYFGESIQRVIDSFKSEDDGMAYLGAIEQALVERAFGIDYWTYVEHPGLKLGTAIASR